MSGTQTPTPTAQRLTVEPLDQWGNLIKSWATQENYFDTPYAQQPPRNNPNGQSLSVDWALPPMAPVPIPRAGGPVALPWALALTRSEFETRLAAVQFTEDGNPPRRLDVYLPPQYQHIIIVQGDPTTMVLRLPPKDTLQASENDLINGVPYKIPDFYLEHYKPEVLSDTKGPSSDKVRFDPPTILNKDKIMELHAYRIGEYTLNTCN